MSVDARVRTVESRMDTTDVRISKLEEQFQEIKERPTDLNINSKIEELEDMIRQIQRDNRTTDDIEKKNTLVIGGMERLAALRMPRSGSRTSCGMQAASSQLILTARENSGRFCLQNSTIRLTGIQP